MGKRVFDIVVSALLLGLVLPVMVIAVVGAALSLRAAPFFVQERVGFGGRLFRIVKIRTLPPTTPRYTDKYALAEVAVPWFTKMLRTLHLDELPQLVQVLFGRMSLVGPRPEMPHLAALLDEGVRSDRERFRPGCTGLRQVSRDADRLMAEVPAYDRFYATYASVRLDLYIMVRTVLALTWPSRRIVLDDVPAWALRQPAIEAGTAVSAIGGPSIVVSDGGYLLSLSRDDDDRRDTTEVA